jgi:uncharacterized protein (TIGR01777 family)
MKIAITGSSGLIGKKLTEYFRQNGHFVVGLVRDRSQQGIYWNPQSGLTDAEKLNGYDAIIHLAGENLAAGRWTQKRKQQILDSRVAGTALISKTIMGLQHPPRVFISSSAVGYYGDTGSVIIDESAPNGSGFLAAVCRDWENAVNLPADSGVRTVTIRLGMVVAAEGGAMGKLLPVFRAGLGGKNGAGRQYMSWISIDDVVAAIQFLLEKDSARGVFNLVAPNPVTNQEFMKTLAAVLHRPAIFPVPGLMLKLIFGEMATETILSGSNVQPAALLREGYQFKHPDLQPALKDLLK